MGIFESTPRAAPVFYDTSPYRHHSLTPVYPRPVQQRSLPRETHVATRQQVRSISASELASHASAQSAWLVVHGDVWDVTRFLSAHPGGRSVLLGYLGRDATDGFQSAHRYVDPQRYATRVGHFVR